MSLFNFQSFPLFIVLFLLVMAWLSFFSVIIS